MSTEREELHRLVEELPEDAVPAILAGLRRHDGVREGGSQRSWPPAWFGAGQGRRTDTAARSEELLQDGFGRPA